MKKHVMLIVGMMSTGVAHAVVLAGWYNFEGTASIVSEAPDVVFPGVDGIIGRNVETNFPTVGGGSAVGAAPVAEDNTFGNVAGADNTTSSSVILRMNNNGARQLDIKITNTTGSALRLDGFHFDWRKNNASTLGTQIQLLHFAGQSDLAGDNNDVLGTFTGGNYQWFDVDVDLSATVLADRVLANGESAAFRLALPNTGETMAWYVDNIAITGSEITGPYDAWALGYGLAGTNALDTANPDGDALNNLGEYGFGGDPTNANNLGYAPAAAGLASAGGTNYIEYVYPRRTTADNGLTYTIQQRYALVVGDWTNSTDYIETGAGVLDADFESVTNRIPADGKSKEFLRVNISR